jgi:hypothetical protein
MDHKFKAGDQVIARLGPGSRGIRARATIVDEADTNWHKDIYWVRLSNTQSIKIRAHDLEPINALDLIAEQL